MVRRSFSNPFLKVFSRRRSKNDNEVASKQRKESMDHTVLSGDDSRFRSVASDGSMPSHAQPYQVSGAPPSPGMRRASKSDPSMRYPGSPVEACQCHECIATQDRLLQNARTESANSYRGVQSLPYYPQQQQQFLPTMNAMHNQEFVQPSSNNSFGRDPTMQARTEAVEIQQRMLGEHHPDVIFALSSLAKLCQKRGDFEGALSIMRECQMRTMKAKTLAYEQQVSRIQQQEMDGRGVLVPSEISYAYENSYHGC
jgi:hypothetical protein